MAIVVAALLSLLPRGWQLPGGLLLAWSGFLVALGSNAFRRRPRER
ncbi:MAG TPA: hypothetical protein VH142_11355 [Polyangiaceae bacterium]|nr:hypothetical protein [Polyangiaceae bacterium]